jgi:hypothetical protein
MPLKVQCKDMLPLLEKMQFTHCDENAAIEGAFLQEESSSNIEHSIFLVFS